MRAREFVSEDLAGAVFREVDLTGARMFGVLLTDADLDGDITGLRVNEVEIGPLVEAELDRLHPERAAFRPTTADGLREAAGDEGRGRADRSGGSTTASRYVTWQCSKALHRAARPDAAARVREVARVHRGARTCPVRAPRLEN